MTDGRSPATSGKKQIIAWGAMLVIGMLWGGTIPLSKIATSTGHQPLGLIFWQLITAVFLLGAVLAVRQQRIVFNLQRLIFYTIIALIGTILPNGASFIAYPKLPGGVMAITIATVPMFTFLIALIARLEGFTWMRFAGLLIGFTAMAMIAAPQTSLPDPALSIFVLVALLAPLFYGLEANYISARTPSGTDAISTLFVASCIGIVIVAPLMLATDQWIPLSNGLSSAEYALFGASAIHAITYVGYIWLVTYGGPVFSVQVAYPVTLSGVFLSILFLNEGYSTWIWAALILVIIGLALVQPKLNDLTAIEPKPE